MSLGNLTGQVQPGFIIVCLEQEFCFSAFRDPLEEEQTLCVRGVWGITCHTELKLPVKKLLKTCSG